MDASAWLATRDRLAREGLIDAGGHLSLRAAGGGTMWFGRGDADAPALMPIADRDAAPIDARVYAARGDVGAILVGGGDFSHALASLGGRLPMLFDEQARHLRALRAPCAGPSELAAALKRGTNLAMVAGEPVCLGMTPARLALNAELFEKCAKAYALAHAAGGPTPEIPIWVQWIAGRRLLRDERRAKTRYQQGLAPEDNNSY